MPVNIAYDVIVGNTDGTIFPLSSSGNGGQVLTSQGSGNQPVWASINFPPPPVVWQDISASQSLASGNGYICTAGGALTLTLPASSKVGDTIEVTLDGSTSFTIAQNGGQAIRIGNHVSTTGAGGSIASNAQGDSIRMICSVTGARWNVVSGWGNLTVV